jgi:hypothetical protein
LLSHHLPPLKHGIQYLKPHFSLSLHNTPYFPLQKLKASSTNSTHYQNHQSFANLSLVLFIFVHPFIKKVCISIVLDYEKLELKKG